MKLRLETERMITKGYSAGNSIMAGPGGDGQPPLRPKDWL